MRKMLYCAQNMLENIDMINKRVYNWNKSMLKMWARKHT